MIGYVTKGKQCIVWLQPRAGADPSLGDITHLLALDPGLGCYQGAVAEREEEEEEKGGGRVVHGSGSGGSVSGSEGEAVTGL